LLFSPGGVSAKTLPKPLSLQQQVVFSVEPIQSKELQHFAAQEEPVADA